MTGVKTGLKEAILLVMEELRERRGWKWVPPHVVYRELLWRGYRVSFKQVFRAMEELADKGELARSTVTCPSGWRRVRT